MIKFIIKDNLIEIDGYSPDVSLSEMVKELEIFRFNSGLKTEKCAGCGECCGDDIPVLGLDLTLYKGRYGESLILPSKPDIIMRQKAIKDLICDSMPQTDAALIYEYNNAEPVILKKNNGGDCIFLEDGFCGSYQSRPYSCGLYLCNMGERLSCLEEMIVRQGTWHAYFKLGWISEYEIRHNPFLSVDSYDKLMVKDFDFDLKGALDRLFFYF